MFNMPDKNYKYTIGLDVDAKTLKTAIKNDVRDALKECDKIGDALAKGLSPDTSGLEGRLSRLENYMEKLHEATNGTKEEFSTMKKAFAGFVELQARVSNLEDSIGAINTTLNNTTSSIQAFMTAFTVNNPEQAAKAIATALQHVGDVGGSAAAGMQQMKDAAQQAAAGAKKNFHEIETEITGSFNAATGVIEAAGRAANSMSQDVQKAAKELERLDNIRKTYGSDKEYKSDWEIKALKNTILKDAEAFEDLKYEFDELSPSADNYNEKLTQILESGHKLLALTDRLSKALGKDAATEWLSKESIEGIDVDVDKLRNKLSSALSTSSAQVSKVKLKPLKLEVDISDDGKLLEQVNKQIDKLNTSSGLHKIEIETLFVDPLDKANVDLNDENIESDKTYQKIEKSLKKQIKRVNTAFEKETKDLVDKIAEFKKNIDESLELKFDWQKGNNASEIQKLFDLVQELSFNNPIILHPDTDNFIKKIDDALKAHEFTLKLDNSDVALNAKIVGGVPIAGSPVSGPLIRRNVNKPSQPVIPQQPLRAPDSSPASVEEKRQTKVVDNNSQAVVNNTDAVKEAVGAFKSWTRGVNSGLGSKNQNKIDNAMARKHAMKSIVGFDPTELNSKQLEEKVADLLQNTTIAETLGSARTSIPELKSRGINLVSDNFLQKFVGAQDALGVQRSTHQAENIKHSHKEYYEFAKMIARMGGSLKKSFVNEGVIPGAKSLEQVGELFEGTAYTNLAKSAYEYADAVKKVSNEFADGGNLYEYMQSLEKKKTAAQGVLDSSNATKKERDEAQRTIQSVDSIKTQIIDKLRPFGENYESERKQVAGLIASISKGFKFTITLKGENGKEDYKVSFNDKTAEADYHVQYYGEMLDRMNKIDWDNNVVASEFSSTINNSPLHLMYDNVMGKGDAVNAVVSQYNALDDQTKAFVNTFITDLNTFLDEAASTGQRWKVIEESFFAWQSKGNKPVLGINPTLDNKYKRTKDKEDSKTAIGQFLNILEQSLSVHSPKRVSAAQQRQMNRGTEKGTGVSGTKKNIPASERKYGYSTSDRAYRTEYSGETKTLEEYESELTDVNGELNKSNIALEQAKVNLEEIRQKRNEAYKQELAHAGLSQEQRQKLKEQYPDIQSQEDFEKVFDVAYKKHQDAKNKENNLLSQVESESKRIDDLDAQIQGNSDFIAATQARIDNVKKAGGVKQYVEQLNQQIRQSEERASALIAETNKRNKTELEILEYAFKKGEIDEGTYNKQKQEIEAYIKENERLVRSERNKYETLKQLRDSFIKSGVQNKDGTYLSTEEYEKKQTKYIQDATKSSSTLTSERLASTKRLNTLQSDAQQAANESTAAYTELYNLEIAFNDEYQKYVKQQHDETKKKLDAAKAVQNQAKLNAANAQQAYNSKKTAVELENGLIAKATTEDSKNKHIEVKTKLESEMADAHKALQEAQQKQEEIDRSVELLSDRLSELSKEIDRANNLRNPNIATEFDRGLQEAQSRYNVAYTSVEGIKRDKEILEEKIRRLKEGKNIADTPISKMTDKQKETAVRKEVEAINEDLKIAEDRIEEAKDRKEKIDAELKYLSSGKNKISFGMRDRINANYEQAERDLANNSDYQKFIQELNKQVGLDRETKKAKRREWVSDWIDKNDTTGKYKLNKEEYVAGLKAAQKAQEGLIATAKEYQGELNKHKDAALAILGVKEEELFAEKQITQEKENQTKASSTPSQGITAKPQSKSSSQKESGYDLIKGITLREEPNLSGQKLEEQIVRTTDFLLDKVFNEKNQFFTNYMDEEDIDQLETYGKVLEKIGYHYSELRPDIADDGHQLGFIADIVADSENAVTNLEEARRIILNTKASEQKVESQSRQIDDAFLREIDARVRENDNEIAELRNKINSGIAASGTNTSKFADHYAKVGIKQIDTDVDKANQQFYQTLKQGSPNKKGYTFVDFSDAKNLDAIITKAKELRAELLRMHKDGKEGSKEYITLQRQLSKLLETTRKGVSKTALADGYEKNKSSGAMSAKAWSQFLTDRGGADLTKFIGSKTNVGSDSKFNDAIKVALSEKIGGFSEQYQAAAEKAYIDAFNAKKAELSGSKKNSGQITAIAYTAGQKAFEDFIKKSKDGFVQGASASDNSSAGANAVKAELLEEIEEIEQENKEIRAFRDRYIKGMLSGTEEDNDVLIKFLGSPEEMYGIVKQAKDEAVSQIDPTGKTDEQIGQETKELFKKVLFNMLTSAVIGAREGIYESDDSFGDEHYSGGYINPNNEQYDGEYYSTGEFAQYGNLPIQANTVIVNGNTVGTSGGGSDGGSGPWALETTLGRTNEILKSISSKIDAVKGGSGSDDDYSTDSGGKKKKKSKIDVDTAKATLYKAADENIAESFGEGTKSVRKFNADTLKLYETLTLANGETVKFTYSINKMDGSVKSSYTTIASFENVAKKAYAELGKNQIATKQMLDGLNFPEEKVTAYNNAITALDNKLKSLGNKGVTDPNDAAEVETLTGNVKKLRAELEGMAKASVNNVNSGALVGKLSADDIDNVEASMKRLAKETYGASVANENFDRTTNTLTFTAKTGKNEITNLTYKFDQLTRSVVETGHASKTTTGFFKSFFSDVGRKVAELSRYYTGMSLLTEAIQQVRRGVQYIRDIDLALTELKKVTNESEASYNRFLRTMSNTASVVGSTVSELTNSAAAWARLGYSMQEAGELAKNTAILLNVSEFESEEKATEALISSLQAFNYSAEDSIRIVDKLNIVGNNFAISSDGIAEGLSRSASTLVAAGNSLEESIAMLAAGNKVQQDPEGLGNALKVLSMRIRGTKTDLEEAGEETDGMIENTSKLRDKVMALTDVGDGGVDILTDTGAYKSTYQILLEIAEVWDKINETDPKNQAALLEILAGKTRGSQVASILQNPEDLKDAYEMALDSDGSAQRELETYMDSIQGRIDVFTNALQTMWMDALNSDAVKKIVDAGTLLINILDKIISKIGLVGTVMSGLLLKHSAKTLMNKNGINGISELFSFAGNKVLDKSGFKPVIDEFKNSFAILYKTFNMNVNDQVANMVSKGVTEYSKYANAIKSLTAAKQAEVLINNGLAESEQIAILTRNLGSDAAARQAIEEANLAIASNAAAAGHNTVAASMIGQLVNTGALTTEQAAATISTLGLVTAEGESVIVSKADALAKIQAAIAAGTLSAADAEAIISVLGLNAATTTGAVGLKAFTASIWGAVKALWAFLTTNPVGWAILAAGAIAGTIALISAATTSHKEYVEQIEESTRKLEEIKSELKSVNDELETTKERIDDLEGKGSLSFAEEEELKLLKEQNNELDRRRRLLEAQDKREKQNQAKNAVGAANSDNNLKDGYNNSSYGYASQSQYTSTSGNKWEYNLTALELAQNDLNKAQEELDDAVKHNMDSDSEEFKQLEKNVEDAEEKVNSLNNTIDNLDTDWQSKYGSIGYIENATTEDEKEWNKIYQQHQANIAKQALLNGTYTKADVLDTVFSKQGTDAAKAFNEAFSDKIDNNEFSSLEDATKWAKKMIESSDELASELEYLGLTEEDVAGYHMKVGEYADSASDKISATVTSIDKLTSAVESYKSALQIVNEIVHDGQAISEDYYNTLKEQLAGVTYASQDLSDAIDSENGYVVKNVSLLKNLVAQSRNAQQATIKTAKAQAQLQYKELVGQIRSSVIYLGAQAQANEFVSRSIADNINVMRDQMDTIEQTIQEYALLELSLSDAANAFDEYEKAKERDAKMTYDDSMLEMLKTIDEGLLKNETGTEAFEYAVKAVIPEQFWKDIDDVDEKVKSIHDYLDGDPVFSRFFYVDEDSGELDITADNVREFVDLCTESGLFDGNSKDFALNDSVKGIKDFAEGLGVTESVALAMLTALEKVDAKWGNILTDVTLTPFERQINATVNDMATLNKQFADGSVDIGTYSAKMAEAEIKLAQLKEEAKKAILGSDDGSSGFTDLHNQVTDASNKVNTAQQKMIDAQKEYDAAVKNGASIGTIDALSAKLSNATNSYKESLGVLDEVTKKRDELYSTYGEYTIKCVLEDVDAEIAAFGNKFNETLIQEAGFKKDENGYWVSIDPKLDLSDLKAKNPELASYIEKLNQKTTLEALLDPTKAEESANALQTTVNNVIDAIEKNLITLELDDEAVKNVVSQANKILSGIATEVGVWLNANLSERTKKILKFLGVDVGGDETPTYKSPASSSSWTGKNTKSGNTVYALGNAFSSGNIGLNSSEHNAVVGELGQEMVVDPYRGVYYTVGDNGTEMVDLPKGAIIYNHKQTEELLKNGRTSRGKLTGGLSFAHGNAHNGYGIPSYHPNLEDKTSFANYTRVNNSWDDAASTLLDAADALADSADGLEDTINWIDVLFTRIDNNLSEQEARFEHIIDSTGGLLQKDYIYNEIYGQLYSKASASLSARDYYAQKAQTEMAGLPADIQAKIRSGAIDIQDFKFDKSTEGLTETQKESVEKEQKAFEKYVEKIQNAIEYYDKISEYEQQYWTTLTEIADKAVERQEEVAKAYENEIGLTQHLNDALEARNDLEEAKEGFATKAYYDAQIDAQEIILEQLEDQRKTMQHVLDEEVKYGRVKIGSQQWFDMQQAIYDVDDAIIDTEASIEDLQNSINDLHWARFDELINRFGYLEEEIGNVVQLLSHDPIGLVAKELADLTSEKWTTDSGLATIGLYAQEMERAQYVANQYAEAIKELEKDYAAGKYNETEYLNKLNELISAQYENIEKYYDAKDAIIELNEARVDAIRDGIEKEIDAYDELISKKKELLDKEQDLHDFRNEIAEKEKDVADLRKQLAAMDGDNTAATVAKKKQLEAQLVEAQKALEESHYSHSMTARQEALDKEFSDFEEEKNKEIEKWEEWLKNTEGVVGEALEYVKKNTADVYTTLTGLGTQYGLTMSTELTTPWQSGEMAIDSYSTTFELATSTFTGLLEGIKTHWDDIAEAAELAAKAQANALKSEYKTTVGKIDDANNGAGVVNNTPAQQTPTTPSTPATNTTQTITVGSKVKVSSSDNIYSSPGVSAGRQYYKNDPVYIVTGESNGYYKVRHHTLSSGVTGWFPKSKVSAYAKGTNKIREDQIALLNELGPELQLVAGKNGTLDYVKYGTSIIPSDISEKLIGLAVDPTSIFDGMRTDIKAPSIETKDFNYEFNFDSLLHVDNASNDSIPALQKMIRSEFNTMMSQVNNKIKRSGKS